MKLRKGDPVVVIAGKDQGKQGVIERAFPKQNKVIVTGVNTASRHQKARKANDSTGIIHKDMPIDVSNVMYMHKGKAVRLGYSEDSKGNKVRIARPSGEEIK